MNAIRRLTTSIVTSFESMISQVENHEAVVNAALKEVEETAGRAHAQLAKVKTDGLSIRRRLEESQQQSTLWKDRAIHTATLQREKAIECLRRAKKAEQEAAELHEQLDQHLRLERQLNEDLIKIGDKTAKLRRQRNALRSRQSCAQALGILRQDDSQLISELDDIFDRWEFKVTQYEHFSQGGVSIGDDLEHEFSTQESNDALSSELDQLIQAEK